MPMNPKPKIGDRFTYEKETNTTWLWEITELQERGAVVVLVYNGSKGHHGHKHLAEWDELAKANFK